MSAAATLDQNLIAAFAAGKDACDALKVGGVFKGAWGHSADAGYAGASQERDFFAHGFLANLPGVWTDRDGKITKLIY